MFSERRCTQKVARKKLFSSRQFYTLFEQKFSNLKPHLFITFPKGFRISKHFWHWILGSGGKRTFKRSRQKMDRQTDRQTHTQTDKSIYTKTRPRRLSLRKTKKSEVILHVSPSKCHLGQQPQPQTFPLLTPPLSTV